MTSTPTQASGGDGNEGAADGVNDAPAKQGGGESGGGAYPNAKGSDTKKESGFLGHGGQTDIDYSGTGGKGDRDVGNGNAVTGE